MNKGFKTGVEFVLALALAGGAILGAAAQAPTPLNGDKQFTRLIHSVEGPDLFRAYCAACHGLDAKGTGPAAPALTAKVPDLTLLARNDRGRFPAARVRQTILGDAVMAAHGSQEMPIWGPIFHQVEADTDWGNVRVEALVKYLQSIQTSTTSAARSGAELCHEHCAACHGDDLKGSGPGPYPFKAPPDLTTLARRRGGKFPAAYVADVLRNGIVMDAHGAAQMPIWGPEFATDQTDATSAASKIASLTDYVRSRQAR